MQAKRRYSCPEASHQYVLMIIFTIRIVKFCAVIYKLWNIALKMPLAQKYVHIVYWVEQILLLSNE